MSIFNPSEDKGVKDWVTISEILILCEILKLTQEPDAFRIQFISIFFQFPQAPCS